MKRIHVYMMIIVSLYFFSACSDMNDLHNRYLKDGETVYLAKFDSISLHPGRGRIQVEYWQSDPKAKKCLVEWALGGESTLIDISLSVAETPNSFFINELTEGTISFDFTACTADLNYKSLKKNSTCSVYGDKYAVTLMNATVKSPTYNSEKRELKFTWSSNYENVVGYSIRYTNTSGIQETVRFPVTDDRIVVLPNFPAKGSFEYATIYLPTPLTIDEFETPYATYTVK